MAGPSRELYRSESVAVGTFRCRPGDAEFDGGWIDRPTLVFPRTCVKITQQGADTVVADPNTVVLYRGRQEYARARVDEAGDHCEWFEVDPGWLREAAAPFDPEVAAADAPPVRHTHAPATPEAYALQRALTRMLSGAAHPDPMQVDETLLRLVDLVIPLAYRATPRRTIAAPQQALVDDTKAYLATHSSEPLSLESIGATVGSSRFHLARLFRRLTGGTIHRHLTALRLRKSLGLLDAGEWGISEIALDVGFSSHSHFTQVFRTEFGVTPSVYRRNPELLLRTISTA